MSIDARIADDQPDSFAFTKENEAEIKRIIAKYPKEALNINMPLFQK